MLWSYPRLYLDGIVRGFIYLVFLFSWGKIIMMIGMCRRILSNLLISVFDSRWINKHLRLMENVLIYDSHLSYRLPSALSQQLVIQDCTVNQFQFILFFYGLRGSRGCLALCGAKYLPVQ